ncbi:MAG: type II toxin-antitoxin system VapB family antitoxin [Gemmatimonadales bacterium]
MRTSVDLNDRLLRDAKRRAADEGTTLKAVFERALREYLGGPKKKAPYTFQWRTEKGELLPGIDIDSRESLYRVLDEDDPFFKPRP